MQIRSVLIVAGGSGQRFSSGIPKQFMLINSKPMLLYSLEAFYYTDDSYRIYIALPKEWIAYWTGLCDQLNVSIPFTITPGGRSRFESVKNALPFIDKSGYLAIHDAARPLLSSKLIKHCFENAHIYGNAVPVINVQDSIREKTENESHPVDREKFYLVQTPQVFQTKTLISAYEKADNQNYTDDASLVETFEEKIHLVEGDSLNFKVTFPYDIKIAETLLRI